MGSSREQCLSPPGPCPVLAQRRSTGLLNAQQHGDPPAPLGFAGCWHRAGKTCGPLFSARKGINSLAKNKVQKTYGKWLFVRQIISAHFFFSDSLFNSSVCVRYPELTSASRTCCACISRQGSLRDSFLSEIFLFSTKACNRSCKVWERNWATLLHESKI